jgi:DNA-directed RNA polymerase specialized sigma24 family protein
MGDVPSTELLARWRAGDKRAADELFSRYTAQLVKMVRRQLSAQLARRVDPEDVVQSAYRCFCTEARAGKVVLERSGDLLRLLARITLNRLHHQVERHTAGKRAVERDQGFGSETDLAALGDAVARTPGPSEVVSMIEELELAMSGLSPPHRQMIEMELQGCRPEEIARVTDRSERLVRKVRERFKDRLYRRCGLATEEGGGTA